MAMQRIDAFARSMVTFSLELLNPKIDCVRDLPDLIQEITRELKVSLFIGPARISCPVLERSSRHSCYPLSLFASVVSCFPF
jgi:hypothetical protein